jgi:hypothetical protein
VRLPFGDAERAHLSHRGKKGALPFGTQSERTLRDVQYEEVVGFGLAGEYAERTYLHRPQHHPTIPALNAGEGIASTYLLTETIFPVYRGDDMRGSGLRAWHTRSSGTCPPGPAHYNALRITVGVFR